MAPRRGHTKYDLMDDIERGQIVKQLAKGKSNQEVALLFGWSEEEVQRVRLQFSPTKGLAKAWLEARALEMAVRITTEANVEEAIDILSRPNIGVLDPAVKGNAAPRFAMITNINTASLGGVQPSSQVVDVTPPLTEKLLQPASGEDWVEHDVPVKMTIEQPAPTSPVKKRKKA